jgi:STE24 endopeptidase
VEESDLDLERQEKAKEYARVNRRLMVVELAIGGVYAIVWLLVGWSLGLKMGLIALSTNQWFLVAGYGLVFGGIYFLLTLPLSYYSGFILPHCYEMSNQTLGGWISDQIKGIALGGVLGGLILEIIYAVLRAAPNTWWLWAGIILLFFSVIMANLAPVLLMPVFYNFQPLDEEREDLAQRLVRLAERAGTRVRGVFKFDMSRRTKAANAALTGLGNTRRIILGDTLLTEFSDDEIETVLAHELGHQVHKDIPVGILVQSLLTLGGLYLASLGLRWGVKTFGFNGVADIAALPLFGLVMGIYGLVTMPLSNAYSRWRERRADEYALEATKNGEAYASALVRLANQNLAEVDPPAWVEFMLYSHPALRKRIAMAKEGSDLTADQIDPPR